MNSVSLGHVSSVQTPLLVSADLSGIHHHEFLLLTFIHSQYRLLVGGIMYAAAV